MPDRPGHEPELLHELKNHLSIIVGFCDMLLADLPEQNPMHADILEVRKAGFAAIALVPALAKRLRSAQEE